MTLRSTEDRWGSLSRWLHWGMFALYVAVLSIGYYMTDLPLGMSKMKIYAFHKSLGMLMLGLVGLRLLWKIVDRGPAPVKAPDWQRLAAVMVVSMLYAVMFALPISGWLYNSAAGFPLRWFNVVHLPALVEADPVIKSAAKSIHEGAAVVLISLVVLHAAAALKHHWIDRDQTLRRMLGVVRSNKS
jgi:cytochrome b561